MYYVQKTERLGTATLVFVLLLGLVIPARAHEITSTTSSTTTIEHVHEVPQVPIERKELSPQAQRRVINLSANISNRTDAAIYRFTAIIARLEARIEIAQSQGYDVTEAQTHLNEAKVALGEAKRAIADIDTEVTTMVQSEKPQESWIGIQDIFKAVAFHLLDTKQLLIQVIADLKGAPLQTPSSNATSTEGIDDEVN